MKSELFQIFPANKRIQEYIFIISSDVSELLEWNYKDVELDIDYTERYKAEASEPVPYPLFVAPFLTDGNLIFVQALSQIHINV